MPVQYKLGSDVKHLMEYRNKSWKCVRCGLCRMSDPQHVEVAKWSDNCPAGTRFRFESYFGSGRNEIVRAMTTDPPEIEVTDKLKEIVWSCTTCGNCQATCQPMKDLEPLNATMALREYLVKKGVGPMPEHDGLVKSIKNYDNPWMKPRALRTKWAKGLDIKDISKEKADVLFYPGCTASYDPVYQKMAVATAKLLKAAGVDFGILGKAERCCGSTMLRIGERDKFEENKAPNVEMFNSLGVEYIVTSCAGCNGTLKGEYAGDIQPEVIHTVEFIDKLIQEGKMEFKIPINKEVTYHDPCHLGRYTGVYDAPRNIIKAIPGLKFTEMHRIKDYSWCCGAGGGVRTWMPEFANWTATRRLEEAEDVGAKAIISACPFCEQNLGDASKNLENGPEVLDLVVMAAESLGVMD